MKKSILLGSLITAGLLSTNVQAQTYNDETDAEGVYIGAGYGYLRADGDDNFDDNKDAYQAFLGYGFNKHFAIEGGFIDFGNYGNDLTNADTDGYTLGIKLGLPVSDNVSVYVRGGQLWYETDYSVFGVKNDYDDEGLFAGLGVSYHINEDWSVKIDYTLYDNDLDVDSATDDIDDANFSTDLKHASLGFEYRF
ncbi:porin family protein [Thalassotalea sp. 1_MG-2023]|uniref:porin family protein n=1 Tax=Thalassotalea sp. 1_MG-2023 TaxID=3062680 RepID=UPI0026E1BC46|nr:porin family protein [Thalassotalea sp. 1_MG-2023]MDO6427690.1 porin family protein [Thalassotalea sp. 1_MG-2023]